MSRLLLPPSPFLEIGRFELDEVAFMRDVDCFDDAIGALKSFLSL